MNRNRNNWLSAIKAAGNKTCISTLRFSDILNDGENGGGGGGFFVKKSKRNVFQFAIAKNQTVIGKRAFILKA